MSAEPNLNETDYELLSAYIDDTLADDERSALEARLKQEPALRQELKALQATIALVQQLPVMKAPRNFTLTAAMVDITPGKRSTASKEPSRVRRLISYPTLSFASAAASVALILLGFALVYGQFAEDDTGEEALNAVVAMNAELATEEATSASILEMASQTQSGDNDATMNALASGAAEAEAPQDGDTMMFSMEAADSATESTEEAAEAQADDMAAAALAPMASPDIAAGAARTLQGTPIPDSEDMADIIEESAVADLAGTAIAQIDSFAVDQADENQADELVPLPETASADEETAKTAEEDNSMIIQLAGIALVVAGFAVGLANVLYARIRKQRNHG